MLKTDMIKLWFLQWLAAGGGWSGDWVLQEGVTCVRR